MRLRPNWRSEERQRRQLRKSPLRSFFACPPSLIPSLSFSVFIFIKNFSSPTHNCDILIRFRCDCVRGINHIHAFWFSYSLCGLLSDYLCCMLIHLPRTACNGSTLGTLTLLPLQKFPQLNCELWLWLWLWPPWATVSHVGKFVKTDYRPFSPRQATA